MTARGFRLEDLFDAQMGDASAEPVLALLTSGFFLYPVQDDMLCTTIAAPRVDLWPHATRLGFVESTVVDVVGALTSYVEKGLRFFDMTGLSMTIVRQPIAPAHVNHIKCPGEDDPDFTWITDFVSLCSGVRLNPKWASSPQIDFKVGLTGGFLMAAADKKSLDERWKWDIDGVSHVQRVTSFSGYLSHFASLTLRFDTLQGAPVGAIHLRASRAPHIPQLVVGTLESMPAVDPPNADTVRHAHTQAFLNLCEPTGAPITIAKPERVPGRMTLAPRADREKSDIDIILEYIDSIISPRWDGTPECSGHRMEV